MDDFEKEVAKADAQDDNLMSKVKKRFRPDWLDSENTIFINKLNTVTQLFDTMSADVSAPKITSVLFIFFL